MFCVLPLFSGCVAPPVIQTTVVTTVFTEPILGAGNTASKDFNLQGRVSIRNERQRFSSSVRWQHMGVFDEILLLSPLGQAVARIQQDHNGARLTTSEKRIYYAADVENLTEKFLGWRLPLNGLQYWIQGTHSPATSSVKDLDKEDRVVAIRQDGWQVFYNEYFSAQQTKIVRPKKLELNYKDLKIKLVVDNWIAE